MARKSEKIAVPLSAIGDFPSHWIASTLEDSCDLVIDGTHDSPKPSLTGFPLITGRCITQGRVDFSNAYNISEEEHKKVMARSKPEKGDILFANIGNSIGDLALVDVEREFSIKNVALFKPGSQLNSLFLKYYLLSPQVQAYVRNTTLGSAQPFLSLAMLRAFPIPLPPRDEQKAIAYILGILDDKIELNQQMNHTLESVARALFKSWFIDFDPVRAKIDGRQPAGMDAETAALFPDEFKDSVLGKIPESWKIGRLEEIAEIVMGASPKGDTYNEDGIGTPLVNGPVEFGEYFLIKKKWTTSPTRLSQPGDLVFCVRGSTTGRRVIADDVYCLGRGVCAIRGFKNTQLFVNQTIEIELERLLAKTTGSVFPNLSSSDLREFDVLLPTQPVIEAFCSKVQPLNEKILANIHEIEALQAIRDVLLPKLLSGQLQVI
jgi:type I restriction enzyme S subunit